MHLTKIINKRGLDIIGNEIFILGLHSNNIVSYTINIYGDTIYQAKLEQITIFEENEQEVTSENPSAN